MVTTRFYLDCRAVSRGQAAPLRLVITKNAVRAYLPLNVSLIPSQWDARRQMVIDNPRKVALNNFIQSQKLAADKIIFRMIEAGELTGLSASLIKDRVLAELHPSGAAPVTFHTCFLSFMEKKTGRTYQIYDATLSRLLAHCPGLAKLRLEDITIKWLDEFEKFLAKTSKSKNARNIHLRNIRAVFNYALDENYTQFYPFRKFKIKPVATRKRALTLEQLRKLFDLPVTDTERRYLDFLKLSFFLCGINVIDLCQASFPVNDRLEYKRAKTHRLYSIKLEPETQELISRYSGSSRLVNFSENCQSYLSFYKHLADFSRTLSSRLGVSRFSSYWMRHTWATIAASLDIPKETISAALGHNIGSLVTTIYIDFDNKKVDAANRKVMDWVLYGKK